MHQPNLPHPDFIGKSLLKSKYADSLVEADTRIGHVVDKLRALGLDKGNTLVFWTTDNGAWQDVYPDAGYTPFRGTKGTDREGGNRVPAIAWMPGKIKAGDKTHDIVGGLDFMATFAALAGIKLPEKDLEGQPMIFDSYDMSPLLFGTGKSARETWDYLLRTSCYPERSATTTSSFSSICAAMTARTPEAWRWTATSDGRVPRSISPPFPKSSISVKKQLQNYKIDINTGQ